MQVARRGGLGGVAAIAVVIAAGGVHAAPATSQPSFAAYARLLSSHLQPGTVAGIRANLLDYRSISVDPDFHAAITALGESDPTVLKSDAEKISFWLNAYNLLAIKAVVDRYPLRSIRDGGNFLFPIWKRKVGQVGGVAYSLDRIEHEILRRDFHEPRVHMALVCASLSCPDLRAEPYAAERLEAQLREQTARFLANRSKGLLPGPTPREAAISSIFRWYGDDFDELGGIAAWIRAHADEPTRLEIAEVQDAGLDYLVYDWSLNDAARSGEGG